MTSNLLFASSVESGRWENSGGGRAGTLCEALRDSLGASPGSIFSMISPPTTASFSGLIAGDCTRGDDTRGDSDTLEIFRRGVGRPSLPEPEMSCWGCAAGISCRGRATLISSLMSMSLISLSSSLPTPAWPPLAMVKE